VRGKRAVRVMAFGVFDVLHPGHVFFLSKARRLGSELFVVVARDSTVEKLKGRKPVFDEKARLTLVQALKPVSRAVLGNEVEGESDFLEIVKKFKPAVVALGYDQAVNARILKKTLGKLGLKVKVVRLSPFKQNRFKSSLVKKLVKFSESA